MAGSNDNMPRGSAGFILVLGLIGFVAVIGLL